jgi:hypothetical protein
VPGPNAPAAARRSTSGRRLITTAHTVGVLGSYALAAIAAGHGAAPIGVILVLGWNDEWLMQVIVGWLSIVGLGLGAALWSSSPAPLLCAAGLSTVSWLLFAAKSELLLGTVLYSLPYFGFMGSWVGNVLAGRARSQHP